MRSRFAALSGRRLAAGSVAPRPDVPISWRSSLTSICQSSMRTGMCVLALASPAAWAQTSFSVDSPDLQANMAMPLGHVFKGDGCTGDNHSPELW